MKSSTTRFLLALLPLVAAFACLAPASGASQSARQGKGESKIAKSKPIYDALWRHKVTPQNKRWARRVSECESGRNPNALGAGGRYRGAFQFSRSTWVNSPRSPGGDPVAYSYRTQAFVAVRLKTRDGNGHWPSCA